MAAPPAPAPSAFTLPDGFETWPRAAQEQLLATLREHLATYRDTPVGSPGETAVELEPAKVVQRAHLLAIDDALVGLHHRDYDRLLIVTPPQVGKSERVAVRFPFWWLGHHPTHRIGLASYGADLAVERGKDVMDLVGAHGARYGLRLARGRRRQANWRLTTGGGMVSVGIDGAFTGRPVDLGVIDDPHKDREDADSPTQRAKVWSFWSGTLTPRLAPRAPVVLIMTRWHTDDLAGRLLEKEGRLEDGGRWKVVHLPALADPKLVDPDPLGRDAGGPLSHPKIDPADVEELLHHWETVRDSGSVDARDWTALYQGSPVPDGGLFFATDKLDVVDDWPRDALLCEYWDLASTPKGKNRDPDWTVGALVALSRGEWWILDIRRLRGAPHEVDAAMRAARRDHDDMLTRRPIIYRVEEEGGSSGKRSTDALRRDVFVGADFDGERPTGSKAARARPFAAAVAAENVHLLRGAWNRDFIAEVGTFPVGAHDDQIDAVSGAIATLSEEVRAPQLVSLPRGQVLRGRR